VNQNLNDLDRATDWRKSSRSGAGNDCVELLVRPTVTGVRDTKRRDAGHLLLSDAARSSLLTFARASS
jgi:hypothetical protein